MSEPASVPPVTKKVASAAFGLLLLAAGAALLSPLLTYPMGRDQGVFATAAAVIQAGGAPYRDVWDMKPPAVLYTFWLSFALFGRSEPAPRLLDLVWTLATAAGLWALGRRLLSPWAGIAAAFLFLLRYITHDYYWHTTQCDGFASLPLTLAALALARAEQEKSPGWAGLCGGLTAVAIAFKLTLGIFILVPIIVVLASHEEAVRARVGRLAAYLAGCGGVLVVAALLLWQAGALRDMYEIVFVWNSRYAQLDVPGMTRRSGLAEAPKLLLGDPNRLLFPIGLLAIVGGIDLVARRGSGRLRWLAPAWAGAMIAQVWIQGRYYSYHWLPALPPLAMLAAQGLRSAAFLLGRSSKRWVGRAVAAAGLVALCALLGFAYWSFLKFPIRYLMGRVPRDTYLRAFDHATLSDFSLIADRDTASWITDHTEEGTAIFIWGFEPLVYFLADRPPAGRFIYNIPLVASWSPPEWRAELIRDLEMTPPAYILVVHNDAQPWMAGRWDDSATQLGTFPELAGLIKGRYRQLHRVEDFDIWELERPGAEADVEASQHQP